MLHLFIQSSEEKHFPRQVSFIIDLLRNIQSNTGHTKASNMSWHPILGQGSKSRKNRARKILSTIARKYFL